MSGEGLPDVVWVPEDMVEELARLRARRERLTHEIGVLRQNIEESRERLPAQRPHD